MRRIRSKGMKPEMFVRSLVHRLGYRYRLHRAELPGKPDLVFGPKKRSSLSMDAFGTGTMIQTALMAGESRNQI
jgi:DNA mismatch endonuclease (patch repair protein)